MSSKLARRIASAIPALTLTIGAFALSTPAAQAAERDGVCDNGEVCFYHNSNQQGSLSDFSSSVPNYGTKQPSCYDFKGPGNGKGKCIKNDVASVVNRTGKTVVVYYNSNYQGASQVIPAGVSVNLNSALKNQNASHRIGTDNTTPPPPNAGSLENPYPAEYGPNGGYTRRAKWLKDRITQEFPGISCSTYKSSSGSHSTGNGLDCFGNIHKRRNLSNWLKTNARPLKVWYVIHEQKIFSLTRPNAGWKKMENRGSDSANHFDHVHISMQDPAHKF